MPIVNNYYINGVDLSSSTAVFLDAALSICAPDGYYSDGTIVRRQISCALVSSETCPNCCTETCSLWNFKSVFGAFTVSFQDCYTGDTLEVTYPDPTDIDICVVYGSTPSLVSGDADLTLKKECGCCDGYVCNSWTLSCGVGEIGSFFYYDCNGYPATISLNSGDEFVVCSLDGTQPQLVNGSGSILFESCDCGK